MLKLLDKYRSETRAIKLISLAVSIPLVWFLLSYFGFSLALLLLPIIVVAYLAYKMHLQRLAEKTEEITEASRVHLATVEALATAIDARDQIGVGHVRRTQIYAIGIGKILDLSESDIGALRTGALLHDIGKLAIPDHILSKVGKLTAAELEKTKIHPSIGASILEPVGFKTPVVATVKHHHEHWNGTGYPSRLLKDEIPLTARILCVADAFDTLRSARPYRPALTREKARQIMQEEAGKQFDPSIVRVLLSNLAALEADLFNAGFSYNETGEPELVEKTHAYIDQIKLANREVFSLYELAREFSSSRDLRETLALFARKLGEFLPFDTCAIYLLDETKSSSIAAHVDGLNAELLMSRRQNVGQGATGFALKSRERVLNVDPDLDFSYSQSELTQQYTTMASLPLIADDELIGAVTIYACDLNEYGEEHVRLLETISRIAADAIRKSLKHDEATTNSLTDPMTGLPNARSLQLQFEKEVARASRSGSNFQMLMLDLDGFKDVNDNYGHKVGDEMLREISHVINDQLRDYDFLARYGGDEFVALIPEANPNDVLDLCERIEKAVSDFSLVVVGKSPAAVGVSLGASGYPENGGTFDQMIVAADKAMYERKTRRKLYAMTHNRLKRNEKNNDKSDFPNENLIVELDERHIVLSSIY